MASHRFVSVFICFLAVFKVTSGLKCYECQSKSWSGQIYPECHNITDEKFLKNVTGTLNVHCSVRMGNNDDGEPYTERGGAMLAEPDAEGTCQEGRDTNGNYTICYCKNDGCNGGSIYDFLNSTGTTPEAGTTAPSNPVTTDRATTGSNGGEDGGSTYVLLCYNCQSKNITDHLNPECHNITDTKFLEEVYTRDNPGDSEPSLFYTYCTVRMGYNDDGEPHTERGSADLRDAHSEGFCKEDKDWNGPYIICYCKSDACNGGSISDFGNYTDVTAGTTTTAVTTTKTTTVSNGGGPNSLLCYQCHSHSLLGDPNPECHNLTDDKYLVNVPKWDLPGTEPSSLYTYCSISMSLTSSGELRAFRSAANLADANADGTCKEEEDWDGQKNKICYCKSDRCNGGSIDDFGAGATTTPSNAATTGSSGEGGSGADKGEGSGGSGPVGDGGDCSCNKKSSNWDTNLLMLHLSLVILSACFASLSVYNSFKRIRPTQRNVANLPSYFAAQEKTPIRVNA